MYSLKIEDLALSLKPGIKIKIIGLRPGEKIDDYYVQMKKIRIL